MGKEIGNRADESRNGSKIHFMLILSIGTFSLLAFKVIIDTYVFISVLNLVFQLKCFFFLWFNDFLLCLFSLLFGFCESIVCF